MTTGTANFPTLNEILSGFNMAELRTLAKALRIRGRSQMKKEALAKSVSEGILESWILESMLIIQDNRTFALFLRSLQSGQSGKMDIPSSSFEQDMFFKLFFPPLNDDRHYVPDDVREAALPLIENGLPEKRKRYWLLHRYALAAVNLYGLIPADELIDIFNSQSAKKTDDEEVIDALSRFEASHMGYCFWEGYITDEGFIYNKFEDAKDLIRLCDDKPRYVPKAKEFLKYSDWEYYEKSSHTMKLFQFLQKELNAPVEDVADMVMEMYHACVIEADLEFYPRFLAEFDIIMTEDQLSRLYAIIMELHNNARLWSNKGYTLSELAVLNKEQYD